MKFDIFTPLTLNEMGQRDNQEDTVLSLPAAGEDGLSLFAVCDGMGGHSKGEVASAEVANAVTGWIAKHTPENGIIDDSIVQEAIAYAHERLDDVDDGEMPKMGTTLTLLALHRGGVTMGHIGDSRIYHVRPAERKILYKTIDHALVYDLFRSGEISYEEMHTSSRRNVITRAMMPGEENKVKIDLAHTTDVHPGDYFYLCSDGMLEQMSDNELLDILCGDGSDEKKSSLLKSSTLDNKDNHSAILVRVKGVSAELGDDALPNDEAHSNYNEVVLLASMPGTTNTEETVITVVEQPTTTEQAVSAPQQKNNTTPRATKSKGIDKSKFIVPIVLLALAAGVIFYLARSEDKKETIIVPKTETEAEIETETETEKMPEVTNNIQESTVEDYVLEDREHGTHKTVIKKEAPSVSPDTKKTDKPVATPKKPDIATNNQKGTKNVEGSNSNTNDNLGGKVMKAVNEKNQPSNKDSKTNGNKPNTDKDNSVVRERDPNGNNDLTI